MLDGRQIRTLEDFWRVIGEAINGPGGYFGRNLDAIADRLSAGFGAPDDDDYVVEWRDHQVSRQHLGYPPCHSAAVGSRYSSWGRAAQRPRSAGRGRESYGRHAARSGRAGRSAAPRAQQPAAPRPRVGSVLDRLGPDEYGGRSGLLDADAPDPLALGPGDGFHAACSDADVPGRLARRPLTDGEPAYAAIAMVAPLV